MAHRPRSSTIASIRSVPSTHEISPFKVGGSVKLRVAVHDNPQTGSSTPHILLNREYCPGVAPGDVIRIECADATEPCYFIVQVDDPTPPSHIQITIPRDVSDLFKLPSGTEVELSKVERGDRVSADYIEIFFRDQYLGRPDMWRLSRSLAGQCLHLEQRVRFVGAIEAVIKALYRRGKLVKSAFISADTKIIYRSLTANCTIFIQVCQELWDFAEDGERYNEKIVHSFLPALFDHWKRLGTMHVVTIVLMSRVYYELGDAVYAAGPIQRDEDNQQYKDFFKVETDLEVVTDWKPILDGLKESIFAFQRDILLTHHYHTAVRDGNNSIPRLVGKISCAHDGPLLEALNLALQPIETHYIDRSLSLTGVATIVITPGRGYYRVSKALLRLTTTRLLDQGFGVSIICLGRSPLHATPLFSFYGKEPAKGHKENKPESQGGREDDVLWGGEAVVIMDDKERPSPPPDRTVIYWQPFWVTLMYWDLQRDLPLRKDKYIARARMPEFEMLGLLHYDLVSSIAIPPLQNPPDENKEPLESPDSISPSHSTQASEKTEEYRRQFDQDTFTCTSNVAASPLSAHATAMRSDSVHASPLVPGRQRGSLLRRSSSGASLPTKYDNTMPATESSLASRRPRPISAHFDDDIRSRITPFALSTSPKDQRLTRLIQPEHRRKSLLATTEPPPSHQGSTSSQTQPHSHSRRSSSATLGSGPSRPRHDSSTVAPLSSPLAIEAIPEISDNTSINSTETIKSTERRSSVLQFPLMRLASSIFLNPFRSAAGYPPVESISETAEAKASKSRNIEIGKQNISVPSPQGPQPLPITHISPRRIHKSREEDPNPSPGQRNSFTRGSPLSSSPLINTNLPSLPVVISHRSTTLVTSLPPLVNPAFREPPVFYTQTSLARRWEHMFPTPTYEMQIKWKTLCAPGCLPLTVEHMPTEEELAKEFRVHSYETTIGSEMNESFLVKRPVIVRGQAPEDAWGMAIMRVMIALRLAQGFQFVLQKSRIVHEPLQDMSLSSAVTPKPLAVISRMPRGPAEILREVDMPVYLSLSDQIHKIQYDPTAPSIRVERFVRRMPASVPIPYKCLIWPKLGGGYTECHTLFKSQDMELYGWNRLDVLAFGYEQNLTDSLRYWRTRFLVIPSDKRPEPRPATRGGKLLSEEEIRLLGMAELATKFTTARWLRQEENVDSHAPVKFVMTTLGPAACVSDDQLMTKLEEIHHSGSLRKKPNSNRVLAGMSLEAIAASMRMPDGVPIRDNRWHNAYYPGSFTGEEFVSWLLREFRDVSTREQGAEQGCKLEAQGLMRHCRGNYGFIDGHYFYTLNPPCAPVPVPTGPQQGSKRWLYLRTSHEEKPPLPLPTPNPVVQQSETSPGPPTRKRRILSQSFIVNLDPQGKSDQSETAVLHHDIIQNPETAFHFQLHWIGASAKFVDDTIQSWSRTVERYGLRMVEAYVDQIADINKSNFFQSYYPIRLAVPPPVLPEETSPPPEYCVSALLRRFDFVLDITASRHYPASVDVYYSYRSTAFDHSQWVHRSGLVFIQVLEDGVTLAWLTNRLASTRQMVSKERAGERPSERMDQLCQQVDDFCTNPVALNTFWKETREVWMEKYASNHAQQNPEVQNLVS